MIMIITIYNSGELETRYPTTVKVVVLCLYGEYMYLLVCKMIHLYGKIVRGILFSGEKETIECIVWFCCCLGKKYVCLYFHLCAHFVVS